MSGGISYWKLNYQISPIILNQGIAANIPGGRAPIISYTEARNYDIGILSSGNVDIPLDRFFANFQVISGGTMIEQQVGMYPFANQVVAANAVISQPLKVSLLMVCPVQKAGGYADKTSVMTGLQSTLKQHNASGGWYTVQTPSFVYANALLLSLTDVSNSDSKQVQTAWRWDFIQPLLTQEQATQAYNSTMSKIANGTKTDGATSGGASLLNFPASASMPSIIPAGSGASGGSIAQAPTLPGMSGPLFGNFGPR